MLIALIALGVLAASAVILAATVAAHAERRERELTKLVDQGEDLLRTALTDAERARTALERDLAGALRQLDAHRHDARRAGKRAERERDRLYSLVERTAERGDARNDRLVAHITGVSVNPELQGLRTMVHDVDPEASPYWTTSVSDPEDSEPLRREGVPLSQVDQRLSDIAARYGDDVAPGGALYDEPERGSAAEQVDREGV